MIDPTARIHPTADLEADVIVGTRTSIWHRAQVRTGARIGAECVIGRDAFIDEGVTLGDRVKIQNLALVYHGVTVEDGVFIGPNAILTNDRFPRAITATGELARADDWIVSPIPLRHGLLDRRGRRRRGRHRRRALRDRRRRVGRHPRSSPTTRSSPVTRPAASAGCAPAAGVSSTPPAIPVRADHAGDRPVRRLRRHATPSRRRAASRLNGGTDDPDLQARHRPGRGGGRPRGPPLRHARHGPQDGRVRGGLGRLLRRRGTPS